MTQKLIGPYFGEREEIIRTPLRLICLISGGQTGVGRGALDAAELLGLQTNGFAPWGWRTEAGPDPELAALGLMQTRQRNYTIRSRLNVALADATIVFRLRQSAESDDVIMLAERGWHAVLGIPKESPPSLPYRPVHVVTALPGTERDLEAAREFVFTTRARTLHVCGHRESAYPGIRALVAQFLHAALRA